MQTQNMNTAQGHWILAKMGKRVLRPGGKELTLKLIDRLGINAKDEVVEFAPGLGFTASLALKNNPKSYIGVEKDQDAAANLNHSINSKNRKIVIGDAAHSNLSDGCCSKVYGEAMLTMHADHRKSEIIREAHRILKKGGLYGIHELSLEPESIEDELKATIQRDLAKSIRVNARPLTVAEWTSLLEQEGFTVQGFETNGMCLLETGRMIDDEGFFRTLKIGFNILKDGSARKRILEMRSVFRKHEKHLSSVCIVARKN